MNKKWIIFCKVVDNFGDVGVCWRFARNIADTYGHTVYLWIDNWAPFCKLCPSASVFDPSEKEICIEGVRVGLWPSSFEEKFEPADIVVEAFACALPEQFVRQMAMWAPQPVWVNLEYLSAEQWVEDYHRMVSLHPHFSLKKYFFFPGFTEKTGGLIREPGLQQAQSRFNRDLWLEERGVEKLKKDALLVSLFAYEQPGLVQLAEAWSKSPKPVYVFVSEGKVLGNLAPFFSYSDLQPGKHYVKENLYAIILPFSNQADYDELLWACDLNFVRGEDSFVRAQWAKKPFVWHIYPQSGNAHYNKLSAFLKLYSKGLSLSTTNILSTFWYAWNGKGDLAECWPSFASVLPELNRNAHNWSRYLSSQSDLVHQLNQFCSHIGASESKIQAL